ncbi:YSIRK signal domain/LPXTG anchor domain surface protein [Streptococcus macacae]|uniref:Gram-positive cocci surface proteins LPxTG domain-containing protein n=1 Tax=Streptococcus macacae NCTC 11558 TaxID=764298 RepID=G5JZ24_9STRE|nr:YSIRK signal domain/LPXTG anchor domain surface protein [Streptococcus macacae]EHJ52623.1 hypothetical protein STRMA_0441 [Streptococcus macacae NCTC 11558]SUN78278.1 Surface protein Rib [Streptococcus macacae NCTC 11558]
MEQRMNEKQRFSIRKMKRIGAGSVMVGLTFTLGLAPINARAEDSRTQTVTAPTDTEQTQTVTESATVAPATEARTDQAASAPAQSETTTAEQPRTVAVGYTVVYVDGSGQEVYRASKSTDVTVTGTQPASTSVTETADMTALPDYQLAGASLVTQTVTENGSNVITFTVSKKAEVSADQKSRVAADHASTLEADRASHKDESTASAAEAKEPADKSALEALVSEADTVLDESVKTENRDSELVASYTNFYNHVRDKIAAIRTNVLNNGNITQKDIDREVSELGMLLSQLKDSINALNQDYPTYYFYDELKGDKPFQTQIISTENRSLTEPATPTPPAGKVFVGWFYRSGAKAGQPVDFTEIITAAKVSDYEHFIEARYENKVSVTYISEGIALKTVQLKTGELAQPEPVDIRSSGMTFKHWSLTPNGDAYDFSIPVQADITLYAVLQEKWKISFNTMGGSPVELALRNPNEALNVGGVTTTRAGYTFKHWSLTPDGDKVADSTLVTSDLQLYAVWEKNTNTPYTVLYYYENAEDSNYSLHSSEVLTGRTGDTTRYSFTPTDQYQLNHAETAKIAADGTTVIRVYVDRKVYRYTFYRYDGRQIRTGRAKVGKDMTDIFREVNAQVNNPEYAYWDVDYKMERYVTNGYNRGMWDSNVEIYEKRIIGNYRIYQYVLGEGLRNVVTVGAIGNVLMRMINYSIPGFTAQYVGSGTASEMNGISSGNERYLLSRNTPNVYIFYKRNHYTFELVPNRKGITENAISFTVPYDAYLSDHVNLNAPGFVVGQTSYEADGTKYTFTGWYESETGTGEPYDITGIKMPEENIRLYAGWRAEPLNVTVYHDADRTQSTVLKVYKENAVDANAVNRLLSIPEGYDMSYFKGWYTEVNGVLVAFDLSNLIVADTKLIPVWDPIVRKISYDANGGSGTVPEAAEQVQGSNYVIQGGSSLTYDNKQFIGWNTRADGRGTSYRPGQTIALKEDTVLYAQWSTPTPLAISTGSQILLEKSRQSSRKVVFTNKTPSQTVAAPLPEGVSGLQISNSGILSATPRITNWEDNEDSRSFDWPVTVTSGNETVTGSVKITILRDTDGDGIPDTTDPDDDNDGIPDSEDKHPKAADTEPPVITADNATVIEKSPITPISVGVTDNDDQTIDLNSDVTVSSLPDGLTYSNGQITGSANQEVWANDSEESHAYTVTITAKDSAGNQATKTITITVLRDTDGDGISDTEDPDDDNDGIPDSEDKHPKAADNTAPDITAQDKTITEKSPITPIPVSVTDNDDQTIDLNRDVTVSGLPNGLTYSNGQITGSANQEVWANESEESHVYTVTITAKDSAGNVGTKTITITVLRDTDGDGIPDTTDPDDDNDGIPDSEDKHPKAADTEPPVITADNATVTEKTAITPIPVSVTDNDDQTIDLNNDVTVSGLPNGLTYSNGQITGKANQESWANDSEESHAYTVTITAKDSASNQASKTITITVLRDTDGDGIPDVNDPDDDNDGIPDSEDKHPKAADTEPPVITADNATVTEKTAISPIPVSVTDNDDQTIDLNNDVTVSGLPSGLSYANGQITGSANQETWTGYTDESHAYTVTITANDSAGNVATKTITITVLRDTDGDGIPDTEDPDDDNDGIPDSEDKHPKAADTEPPVITADNATVTEKTVITPIPIAVTDNDDQTIDLNRDVTVSGLPNGLTYSNGQITGSATQETWTGDPDESHAYSVTITAKDSAGNQATKTITITVLRDTDGDGIPDTTDPDDDNDGIPDSEDKHPKAVDNTAPDITAQDKAITEKTAISPIPVSVTDNDDQTIDLNTDVTVTGLPSGLSYANGQITGSATQEIWTDDTDESHAYSVTITAKDSAGNQANKTITITVLRDTDGDGIPDTEDPDDDNDGIPDSEDKHPKVADTEPPIITAENATVTEKSPITPIPIAVTDSDDQTIDLNRDVTVSGLPDGLTYSNGPITGSANQETWTGDTDESHAYSVTITARDSAGNQATKTITITVLRDTDGDGIPDVNDPDDDNDGIPDSEDKHPKTTDTEPPVITADNATVTEKTAITPIPVSVTDNDDQTIDLNRDVTVSGLPGGLSYSNGQITGSATQESWANDSEESHAYTVTITAKDSASNQASKTITITVLRDTDGDGIPDVNDPDDDNDGIPDSEDKHPKAVDNTAPDITAQDKAITEKTAISPIPVSVTDNDDQTIDLNTDVTVTGLPSGLSYANGQITGSATQETWTGDPDESHAYSVTITAKDSAGNVATKTITITVLRDTDGDGIPDTTDPDDDNDGIPDSEDKHPKVKDALPTPSDPKPNRPKIPNTETSHGNGNLHHEAQVLKEERSELPKTGDTDENSFLPIVGGLLSFFVLLGGLRRKETKKGK